MVFESLHQFIFHPDLDESLLIQNSFVTYGILLAYVLYTKLLGPIHMKRRKAMDLRLPIILFNIAIVMANIFVIVVGFPAGLKLLPVCCNLKQHPNFMEYYKEMEHAAWLILLIKYCELFDTIFFVLRKKFNQISFLHVFHHTAVCFIYTYMLKSKDIGFYVVVIGFINCIVHIFTYLYYGLSAMGPHMRKYLWWKKYLTTIQIVQFIAVLMYMAGGFLTGCEEFGFIERTVFVATSAVMVLFLNFYFKAYKIK